GTILDAKEIVLIAFGEEKANIVERALYGPIDEQCPASFLRKSPNKVRLCLDHSSSKYI
ncbi:hypothetical protein HYU07_05365, partial [Candidatus Woesearchaeota archaeon]|nr:hypothetical protein [Candidatus Woesearchaeota archaeon]